MSSVEGTNRSPEDLRIYRQEYKHGVDLFQRALKEYSVTEESHKKDAFGKVMEEALQLINDAARGLKRPDLLQQNQQIAKHLQDYEDTNSEQAKKLLAQDLNRAHDSV